MRDDIKMFVYRDASMKQEPGLTIRVLSQDGMDEKVLITEMDLMQCENTRAKGELIAKAIRDLASMTILPAEDLLRMSAEGENARYVREFIFPKPRIVPQPKPEPVLETGWMGFLGGVAAAIMEAHKNYVLPKARVVKGGKLK
jgi:hypothetical protein